MSSPKEVTLWNEVKNNGKIGVHFCDQSNIFLFLGIGKMTLQYILNNIEWSVFGRVL